MSKTEKLIETKKQLIAKYERQLATANSATKRKRWQYKIDKYRNATIQLQNQIS